MTSRWVRPRADGRPGCDLHDVPAQLDPKQARRLAAALLAVLEQPRPKAPPKPRKRRPRYAGMTPERVAEYRARARERYANLTPAERAAYIARQSARARKRREQAAAAEPAGWAERERARKRAAYAAATPEQVAARREYQRRWRQRHRGGAA